MEKIVLRLQEMVALYGLQFVLAIVILIVGRMITKMLKGQVRKGLIRAHVDMTIVTFLSNAVYYAMLAFVVVIALAQLGVQTTSLIAVLGAAGLAVGLALQSSLANVASGFLIVMLRPFTIGHYIEAGGQAGTVKDISILTTELRSPDNKTITVPNREIMNGSIVNYSATGTRRLDLVFGVGYEDDLKQVKNALETIVRTDDRILSDPAPLIAVSELAGSSVNLAVRVWVNSGDYLPVQFDLTERVKLAFDEQNISMPFPQQDVHVHYAEGRTQQ